MNPASPAAWHSWISKLRRTPRRCKPCCRSDPQDRWPPPWLARIPIHSCILRRRLRPRPTEPARASSKPVPPEMHHALTSVPSLGAQTAFASSASKHDIAGLRPIDRESSVRAGTTARAMLAARGRRVRMLGEVSSPVRRHSPRARPARTKETNVGAGIFASVPDSSCEEYPAR